MVICCSSHRRLIQSGTWWHSHSHLAEGESKAGPASWSPTAAGPPRAGDRAVRGDQALRGLQYEDGPGSGSGCLRPACVDLLHCGTLQRPTAGHVTGAFRASKATGHQPVPSAGSPRHHTLLHSVDVPSGRTFFGAQLALRPRVTESGRCDTADSGEPPASPGNQWQLRACALARRLGSGRPGAGSGCQSNAFASSNPRVSWAPGGVRGGAWALGQ